MELKANQYFNNRYMLISCMGEGASAQVWKAVDLQANNLPVALKIFSSNKAMDTAGIQNFKHEFTSVFNLNHTNLLTPSSYDIFEGNPYLVMPFCENGSAAKYVGNADEQTIIKILRDVSAGLAYLHENKVVHQDIKPDNILISHSGDYLISDFGISAAANVDDSVVSGFCGTKAYMGPERFNGMPAVFASDIWSLGAMAYEIVTGQVPFGESGGLAQSLGDKIPTISKKISPELKELIYSCMAPTPWERPMAKDIKDKLDNYIENGTWKKHAYKKTLKIITASIIALVVAGRAIFVDYSRTKVQYYKDYAEYWGVPEGVHRLSKKDVKHRDKSYRFEYRNWKLQRVSLVNSADKVIEHSDSEGALTRFADAKFVYGADGKIDYKDVYDNVGQFLYRLDYEPNLRTAILKLNDEHGTEICLSAGSTNISMQGDGNTPITRYLFTYNDDGLVTYREFAGYQNVPMVNDDLVHGIKYKYNEDGLILETQYVGLDGSIRGNKNGMAIKKFEYDDEDNCISAIYLTSDGTASDDGMGRCRYKFECDEYGNRTHEYYLTLDGKPSTKNDEGSAGTRFYYDERGNNILTVAFDENGNRILNSSGYSASRSEYDDNGFVISVTFEDAYKNPTEMTEDGDVYGQIKFERNAVGQPMSVRYYDVSGNPIELSAGNHGGIYEYDPNGNNTLYSAIDINGNIANVNGFYAQIGHKYDDRNQEIERSFLDAEGNIATNKDGISIIRYTYDLRGNNTKIECLDKEGKLVMTSDSYACMTSEYDDYGNRVKVALYDENMKLCNSGNTAMAIFEYDSATNQCTIEKYYDKSEKLVYSEHNKYDTKSNLVERYYTDEKGSLMDGTLVERYKYDDNNQIIEASYHKLDGTLTNHPEYKYAVDKRVYDDRGNRTNRSFWKADGKPSTDNIDTHERIKEYDQYNNVVYEKNLGVNGKPISLKSKGTSPEIRSKYDSRGNQTEIIIYDGYGKPAVQDYHICRMTYDAHNNMTSVAFYDTDDKPMINKDEDYAKVEYVYDDKNRNTESKYYGVSSLKFSWKYRYNSKGKVVEMSRYDSKGNLSDDEYGIAKRTVEYETNEVVPTIQKLYSKGGTQLYYCNYNKDTGEWGNFERPAGAWQNDIRQWKSDLPQNLTEWLVLTDIQYTSSSVTFTLKCTDVSVRTMSSADIESYKEYFRNNRSYFTEGLPGNVRCTLRIQDRTGNNMFSI